MGPCQHRKYDIDLHNDDLLQTNYACHIDPLEITILAEYFIFSTSKPTECRINGDIRIGCPNGKTIGAYDSADLEERLLV
jgi:hypothetical protein